MKHAYMCLGALLICCAEKPAEDPYYPVYDMTATKAIKDGIWKLPDVPGVPRADVVAVLFAKFNIDAGDGYPPEPSEAGYCMVSIGVGYSATTGEAEDYCFNSPEEVPLIDLPCRLGGCWVIRWVSP